MNHEQKTATVERIAKAAPIDWHGIITEIEHPFQRTEVASALEWRAVAAARASAYVQAIADGYSHTEAVKSSNKRVAKVRKALGFTYPKDDINFPESR